MSVIGENLIRLVRQYAAETPDRIYKAPDGPGGRCVYVHEGQPSCIVGKALWSAGIIGPGYEFNDDNNKSIAQIFVRLGLALDKDEVDWLRNIQAAQDGQQPWGEAVEQADEFQPTESGNN